MPKINSSSVATALTVYGIETSQCSCLSCYILELQQLLPFTVLKRHLPGYAQLLSRVATALTVYGIETDNVVKESDAVIWLQQLLPFTVLKLYARFNFLFIVFSSRCNSSYRLRY